MQRALGVTYKTAWRIGHQIRKLMEKADGFEVLKGHVEADEAFIGGKAHGAGRGHGYDNKTAVLGLKERGGRIHAEAIPDVKKVTLRAVVNGTVEKGSIVSTDEFISYGYSKAMATRTARLIIAKGMGLDASRDWHTPSRQRRREFLASL